MLNNGDLSIIMRTHPVHFVTNSICKSFFRDISSMLIKYRLIKFLYNNRMLFLPQVAMFVCLMSCCICEDFSEQVDDEAIATKKKLFPEIAWEFLISIILYADYIVFKRKEPNKRSF